jgi:hypothetical protein
MNLGKLHIVLTHCFAISHSLHSLLCLQKKGQSPLTDTDAVKAMTAARTKERRIVCEDVIWDQMNRRLRVGRRLSFMC